MYTSLTKIVAPIKIPDKKYLVLFFGKMKNIELMTSSGVTIFSERILPLYKASDGDAAINKTDKKAIFLSSFLKTM